MQNYEQLFTNALQKAGAHAVYAEHYAREATLGLTSRHGRFIVHSISNVRATWHDDRNGTISCRVIAAVAPTYESRVQGRYRFKLWTDRKGGVRFRGEVQSVA